MKIIKLTRVWWDTALRVVHTEEMYINTIHIHLFKSSRTTTTSDYITQEYPKLTIMTIGHEYVHVAETPQEIQKLINH